MKKMKFVKMLGMLLCMVIAACCVLTGCGDDESKGPDAAALPNEEVCDKVSSVFFDDSAKNYYGYSLEMMNQEFDDMFTEKKADKIKGHEYNYKIGKVNNLFGGNVDLGGYYETEAEFKIDDEDGLTRFTYYITDLDDSESLSVRITETLDAKLPSDWERKGKKIGDDYKFTGENEQIKLDVRSDSISIACYREK